MIQTKVLSNLIIMCNKILPTLCVYIYNINSYNHFHILFHIIIFLYVHHVMQTSLWHDSIKYVWITGAWPYRNNHPKVYLVLHLPPEIDLPSLFLSSHFYSLLILTLITSSVFLIWISSWRKKLISFTR